jgi:hypothetical protein
MPGVKNACVACVVENICAGVVEEVVADAVVFVVVLLETWLSVSLTFVFVLVFVSVVPVPPSAWFKRSDTLLVEIPEVSVPPRLVETGAT